jgi:hypothetical protein
MEGNMDSDEQKNDQTIKSILGSLKEKMLISHLGLLKEYMAQEYIHPKYLNLSTLGLASEKSPFTESFSLSDLFVVFL